MRNSSARPSSIYSDVTLRGENVSLSFRTNQSPALLLYVSSYYREYLALLINKHGEEEEDALILKGCVWSSLSCRFYNIVKNAPPPVNLHFPPLSLVVSPPGRSDLRLNFFIILLPPNSTSLSPLEHLTPSPLIPSVLSFLISCCFSFILLFVFPPLLFSSLLFSTFSNYSPLLTPPPPLPSSSSSFAPQLSQIYQDLSDRSSLWIQPVNLYWLLICPAGWTGWKRTESVQWFYQWELLGDAEGGGDSLMCFINFGLGWWCCEWVWLLREGGTLNLKSHFLLPGV